MWQCYFATDFPSSLFPPPWNISDMIGQVKPVIVTEEKKTFYFSDHDIYVTVPSEAIPTGKRSQMLLTATLNAPVEFANNTVPVSALVWLHMDIKPKKPIKLQMPHYVDIKSQDQSSDLQFAMSKCSVGDAGNKEILLPMEAVKGGDFPINNSHGTIDIDPLCYICIQQNISVTEIPDNTYRIVFIREKLTVNLWKVNIIILARLGTCLQVLILTL